MSCVLLGHFVYYRFVLRQLVFSVLCCVVSYFPLFSCFAVEAIGVVMMVLMILIVLDNNGEIYPQEDVMARAMAEENRYKSVRVRKRERDILDGAIPRLTR